MPCRCPLRRIYREGFEQVAARLCNACSELHTAEERYQRTALCDLLQRLG